MRIVDLNEGLEPALAAMWRDCDLEMEPQEPARSLREYRGDVGYFKDHGHVIRVAISDVGPVGYWQGVPEPTGELESLMVYVRPEARRQGIGSLLKRDQVATAATRGFASVRADIDPDNEASLAMSRSLGYDLQQRPEGYVVRVGLTR